MGKSVPIILIALAIILVLVALLALRIWKKQKEGKFEQPNIRNKKVFFIQWIIGLAISLTAAFFMFDGDILGENTSGIATVMGIVGIGLIGTSNVTLIFFNRKK